jgi:hypothetical protein
MTAGSGSAEISCLYIRISPGNRNPNPCTERIVTIPSATAMTGMVGSNCPIVAATHASDPAVPTPKAAC